MEEDWHPLHHQSARSLISPEQAGASDQLSEQPVVASSDARTVPRLVPRRWRQVLWRRVIRKTRQLIERVRSAGTYVIQNGCVVSIIPRRCDFEVKGSNRIYFLLGGSAMRTRQQ